MKCEWAGSKIVFTNGSQDPWRHASKQISSPDSESSDTFILRSIHAWNTSGYVASLSEHLR